MEPHSKGHEYEVLLWSRSVLKTQPKRANVVNGIGKKEEIKEKEDNSQQCEKRLPNLIETGDDVRYVRCT